MAACLLVLMAVLLALPTGASAAAVMKEGDNGPAVRALQQRLTALGYLPRGQIDGHFGPATTQGVMALQGWERIGRDGMVGPRTRQELRTAVRPRASRSFSGRRMEVRLDRQVLLLTDARGRVLRAMHISSGMPGYSTPRGSFKVFRKERMSWSNPYEVWLPWASYFVGGVAFHQGSSVPGYPASHGCVRVPAHEARLVYRFASYGTRVHVK